MSAYNFTNYGVFSCGSDKHVHVPYVLCPLRVTRYICLTTLYRKHKVQAFKAILQDIHIAFTLPSSH